LIEVELTRFMTNAQ